MKQVCKDVTPFIVDTQFCKRFSFIKKFGICSCSPYVCFPIYFYQKKIFSASLQFFVISLNSFGWVNIWVKVAISGDLNPNNMFGFCSEILKFRLMFGILMMNFRFGKFDFREFWNVINVINIVICISI